METANSFKFAMAAAGLLLASCSKAADTPPAASSNDAKPAAAASQIKCLGVNECRGQGQCGGPAGNSCAGQNECKGKGWLLLDAKACTDKGGTEYKG
ncbi:MAG TPA: hypothetical protein VL137_18330 [Polyangiaceae bacterium]|nr:hypothetical protein [Polyangiaceae bacterium]